MHWVDRGEEPSRLEAIRLQFTPGWVRYYPDRSGNRPTDTRWQDFRNDLSRVFYGLCAYCEEEDKGEVDHFRPVSKCPNLVYEWTNWVFACHNCNQSKSNKWPDAGYIDPCASIESERPEHFFDFDTSTGELIPITDLSEDASNRAVQMINDLSLNAPHHINRREERILFVGHRLGEVIENSEEEQEFLEKITSRDFALSSFNRALLEEQGFIIDD